MTLPCRPCALGNKHVPGLELPKSRSSPRESIVTKSPSGPQKHKPWATAQNPNVILDGGAGKVRLFHKENIVSHGVHRSGNTS